MVLKKRPNIWGYTKESAQYVVICTNAYITGASDMISGSLRMLKRTKQSLDVKWSHMRNQPNADLYQYYSYYVEYREKGSSDWIRESMPYNPDDDPPQATITKLTSGTEYEVRISGVRTKGDQTDEEDAEKTDISIFITLFGTFSLIKSYFIFQWVYI